MLPTHLQESLLEEGVRVDLLRMPCELVNDRAVLTLRAEKEAVLVPPERWGEVLVKPAEVDLLDERLLERCRHLSSAEATLARRTEEGVDGILAHQQQLGACRRQITSAGHPVTRLWLKHLLGVLEEAESAFFERLQRLEEDVLERCVHRLVPISTRVATLVPLLQEARAALVQRSKETRGVFLSRQLYADGDLERLLVRLYSREVQGRRFLVLPDVALAVLTSGKDGSAAVDVTGKSEREIETACVMAGDSGSLADALEIGVALEAE